MPEHVDFTSDRGLLSGGWSQIRGALSQIGGKLVAYWRQFFAALPETAKIRVMARQSQTRARIPLIQAFLLAILMLSATAPSTSAAPDEEILVFAASSLAPPLEQIATEYESQTGVKPRFAFGSSARLARQIEHGAPADLFITAHSLWLDRLAQKRRIDLAQVRIIAGNRLVIASAGSSPAHSGDIRALLLAEGSGRIATGDPNSVPLGLYARASLTAMGLWDSVSPRLAPAANARAALLQVERGQAPLGILFASDVAGSARAIIIAQMPADTYGPIRYLAAPIIGADSDDIALNFLTFLSSPAASKVFLDHGFSPSK